MNMKRWFMLQSIIAVVAAVLFALADMKQSPIAKSMGEALMYAAVAVLAFGGVVLANIVLLVRARREVIPNDQKWLAMALGVDVVVLFVCLVAWSQPGTAPIAPQQHTPTTRRGAALR